MTMVLSITHLQLLIFFLSFLMGVESFLLTDLAGYPPYSCTGLRDFFIKLQIIPHLNYYTFERAHVKEERQL